MVPGTDNEPREGLARHVYEISKRLSLLGFDIVNLVPAPDHSLKAELVENSYKLLKVPISNWGSARFFLNKIDRHLSMWPHYYGYREVVSKILKNTNKPIVLHTHAFYSIAQPRTRTKLCKRLVTLHGFGQLDIIAKKQGHVKANLLHLFLKKLYSKAGDCYTTFSPNMKTLAVRFYGLNPDAIVVVPHGVDAKFFSEQVKVEQKRQLETRFKLEKEFKILFLGHLTSGKGLDILLKAARILRSRRSDFQLILKMGHSRTCVEAIETVRRLGIEDTVRIITERLSQSDLRSLYHVSDVFVNYFFLSGSSTALLEGMASGVAPIIYQASPLRDIVDSQSGVVLKTLNPLELAEGIEMLAEDRRLTERIGKTAMERTLRNYDWDTAIVPKYISVYNALL